MKSVNVQNWSQTQFNEYKDTFKVEQLKYFITSHITKEYLDYSIHNYSVIEVNSL